MKEIETGTLTVKDVFKQAYALDLELKAKKERILELREQQLAAKAVIGHDKVQTTRKTDKLGDYSALILDLIDEYAKDITRLLVIKAKIKDMINLVENPVYRVLLSHRYEGFNTLEEIAIKMNYGYRHIIRMHKEALKTAEILHSNILKNNFQSVKN